MGPNLIAAIASIIVIVITVIGQWLNTRNDRNLANQELEILKKLDSNSQAARELSELIEFRIAKWHKGIAISRRRVRSAIVWFVIGYMLYLAAFQIAFREKDFDLWIMFGALILFGGVALVVAAVRLLQAVVRRRGDRVAGG
jgi:hypothetical protein